MWLNQHAPKQDPPSFLFLQVTASLAAFIGSVSYSAHGHEASALLRIFSSFCCFVFRFIDKGLGFRVIIVRTGEAGWIESLDFYEICLSTIGETSRTNTHQTQEKRAKPDSLNP